MTFQEAKIKMAVIANGRYFTLNYNYGGFRSGREDIQCMVYIDGSVHEKCENWESAIEKLQAQIARKSAQKTLTVHEGQP